MLPSRQSKIFRFKSIGPVMGGIRWCPSEGDVIDACCGEDFERLYEEACREMEPDPVPESKGMDYSPRITTEPETEARAGEAYAYAPSAFSADVVGFTWSLHAAPEGMSVDRHTGAITWIPADGGRFEVELWVRSHLGAFSRQCWTICVRKARAVRAPVVNKRYGEAIRRRRSARPAGGVASRPSLPVWRAPSRPRRVLSGSATDPPPPPISRVAFPLRN